jgi:F0F1-type ATP synthase assembly protein I
MGAMAKPIGKDTYTALRSGGLLLAIPTLLIVSPLAGFFVGAWLDRRFHTRFWFSILGLILGFVAAGRETGRIYRRSLEEEKRSGRDNREE